MACPLQDGGSSEDESDVGDRPDSSFRKVMGIMDTGPSILECLGLFDAELPTLLGHAESAEDFFLVRPPPLFDSQMEIECLRCRVPAAAFGDGLQARSFRTARREEDGKCQPASARPPSFGFRIH